MGWQYTGCILSLLCLFDLLPKEFLWVSGTVWNFYGFQVQCGVFTGFRYSVEFLRVSGRVCNALSSIITAHYINTNASYTQEFTITTVGLISCVPTNFQFEKASNSQSCNEKATYTIFIMDLVQSVLMVNDDNSSLDYCSFSQPVADGLMVKGTCLLITRPTLPH